MLIVVEPHLASLILDRIWVGYVSKQFHILSVGFIRLVWIVTLIEFWWQKFVIRVSFCTTTLNSNDIWRERERGRRNSLEENSGSGSASAGEKVTFSRALVAPPPKFFPNSHKLSLLAG